MGAGRTHDGGLAQVERTLNEKSRAGSPQTTGPASLFPAAQYRTATVS